MDLEQEWKNLSVEFNSEVDKTTIANITIDEQSHSLLQDLLFKLKWKLRWIRIIDVPILIMAFFAKGDLKYLLVLSFITYEIFRAMGINDLNKIKTSVDYNTNTKQVLIDNLAAIKRMLRGETIYGYIFIPLAGPTGLLAYRLYVHQTFEKVFNLPHFFLHAASLLLIGIPLIYVAKKMNDSIFSAPLKNLNEKIKSLMD
ncbi:hypothetical protein [Pedobacter sp. UBA5917]|jgi:hypothetical protein|uniref:hypothetical protein n=1 Tax=Pedobacter sp. UBA5917 TaxID=1947061 RepID=UPI0025FAAE45|nr:hypothetical protein [Pedobacter sp. UBA5917]